MTGSAGWINVCKLGVLDIWKRQSTCLGDGQELPKLWDWYESPLETKSETPQETIEDQEKVSTISVACTIGLVCCHTQVLWVLTVQSLLCLNHLHTEMEFPQRQHMA